MRRILLSAVVLALLLGVIGCGAARAGPASTWWAALGGPADLLDDHRARFAWLHVQLDALPADENGGLLQSSEATRWHMLSTIDDALRRAAGFGGTAMITPDRRVRLTAPDGFTFVDP